MSGSPSLVAIVDDDSSVRNALCNLVRSHGHSAISFASAVDFLDSAGPRPDCLVCDIHMPGLSGWDLVAQMRASGSQVPTIMITAFSDDTVPGRFADEVRVFHKPFRGDMIVAAIDELIGKDG